MEPSSCGLTPYTKLFRLQTFNPFLISKQFTSIYHLINIIFFVSQTKINKSFKLIYPKKFIFFIIQYIFIKSIQKGYVGLIHYILTKKINVDIESGIFESITLGKLEITEELSQHAPLSICDEKGNSLVHCAIENNQSAMLAWLLKNNVSPNISNNIHETPLHLIAYLNRPESDIKILLEHGGNLFNISELGYTPGENAFANGYEKKARILGGNAPHSKEWREHKMICHRFGLSIKLLFENGKIKLYGYRCYLTFTELIKSLKHSKTWLTSAPLSWNDEDTTSIINFLEGGLKFLFNDGENVDQLMASSLELYKKVPILIIVNTPQHASVFAFYKNTCFRGDRARSIPGISLEEIGNEKKLADALSQLLKDEESTEKYFDYTIAKDLSLYELYSFSSKSQHGKTCTWSAAKLALRIAIIIRLLKKRLSYSEVEKISRDMVNYFSLLDRLHSIEKYIQQRPSPIRDALLSTVFKLTLEKKNLSSISKKILLTIKLALPNVIELAENIYIDENRNCNLEITPSPLS